LGYSKATQGAQEALETGRGVFEVVLSQKLLSREELERLLNPNSMV
jgi:aspartate ammonia-lyase